MENVQVTVITLKNPVQSENNILDCKTPPQINKTDQMLLLNSGIDCPKSVTPDRLRVPKAFKYPERYSSPTDLMMSPISRGLLARTRKGGALLPPTRTQPKIQDLCVQDVGVLQNSNTNAGGCCG